jgi:hypothetical protein
MRAGAALRRRSDVFKERRERVEPLIHLEQLSRQRGVLTNNKSNPYSASW